MEPEIQRSWRDPELLLKALPTVLLQTSCFLAPLLMTLVLTFQRTKDFSCAGPGALPPGPRSSANRTIGPSSATPW